MCFGIGIFSISPTSFNENPEIINKISQDFVNINR